jgi:hypothetical protein
MIVKGTFEVTMHREPPYDVHEGISLGHARIEKRFMGPLSGTSEVHMIAAMTAVAGSAGYVAIERVRGSLDGKEGTFVLQHSGHGDRGARTLSVTVVADSGTAQLRGLRGKMDIQIVEGKHFYELDFTIEPPAEG